MIGEAFAAAKFGGGLHIVNIERLGSFAFVESVVESRWRFGRRREVEAIPIRYCAVLFERTVIRRDAIGIVCSDPILRAESRSEGEFFHRHFDEAGGTKFGEFVERRDALPHLFEVIADGDIVAEVEIIFENVGVFVPMSVKIFQNEPIGVEDFLRFRAIDRIEQ